MDIDFVEFTEIFNLPTEAKKKVIEGGSLLLWEQCHLVSKLTNEKFSVILSRSLGNLELKITELQKEEQYELCYYLNEVIWGVHRLIQENRKDDPVL